MQYDNTNRGALWKNTEMRLDKKDPHFTGQINVSTCCPHCNQNISIDHQVSAWKPDPEKVGPKTPVLSMSVREKPKPAPKQDMAPLPVERIVPNAEDINDAIPWD